MAMFMAALPALLSECAILPPSSLAAARVWKVLTLDGRVGDVLDDPYSTAILEISSASYCHASFALKWKDGQSLAKVCERFGFASDWKVDVLVQPRAATLRGRVLSVSSLPQQRIE